MATSPAFTLFNQRIMFPWIAEVKRELAAGELQPWEVSRWLPTPTPAKHDRMAMLNSPCADCRHFAQYSLYPPHAPRVAGHPNHCTCNGCF
jgi:hypothetical protein